MRQAPPPAEGQWVRVFHGTTLDNAKKIQWEGFIPSKDGMTFYSFAEELYVVHLLCSFVSRKLFFVACCLDVRTLSFCQLMCFCPIKPLKVKLLQGSRKQPRYDFCWGGATVDGCEIKCGTASTMKLAAHGLKPQD